VPSNSRSLDDVVKAAARAIQSLESRLTRLAGDVDERKQELDAARAVAQREREELDIEYSLTIGSQYVVEAPGTEELRAAERALTEQTIRASGLQRQLTEFAALLSTSARQFGAEGELPGVDAATQAAIRSGAVAAQEQERHRLAREIHDGPAQALANAIVALEFVERAIRMGGEGAGGRALEEVERIKSSLREGLTEIRRFIFDLRPTMLQDRGLSLTVEHYIATYQSVFPMSIDLRVALSLPRLTPEQELTAFRVVQEAIQNARKHSRASRVTVSIAQIEQSVFVAISDNGRGFSPERVTTHLMGGAGLRGMRERAALVGGTLSVESAPGEGTTIELEIPISPRDTAPTDGPIPEASDVAPTDDDAPQVVGG
jgi:two-component system sensor histidine kinase DegS